MTLFLAVSFVLTAKGANIFTISQAQGHPGDEVTVSVSLDNSDAVAVAELLIPLDAQMTYVDGSCVLNQSRSNGHVISAGADAEGLKVVVYGFNVSNIVGSSGELFSFKLKLKRSPKSYPLTATAVIGDAEGKSLNSSVVAGTVTILSPEITVVTPSVDYGHIPIRSTYTKNITLKNSGNEPLEIQNIEFSAKEFSVEQSAFTIAAGATKNVTVNYAPTVRGAICETVTFISNAINGKRTAELVADPFSVNELHMGSGSGICDEEVRIALTMNNMEPIWGMQCEIKLPDGLKFVDGSFEASDRASNLMVSGVANGQLVTLIMYGNAPVSGESGELASFRVKLDGKSGTYTITPTKVVLSNATSENMTSATSSGRVTIQSPQLTSNSTLKMGDVAVTDVARAKYAVRNSGIAPLIIERVTFLAEGFSVEEALPITLNSYQSTELTVKYQPKVKGSYSAVMNLYTNDPNNRMKSVDVSGNVYEPNFVSMSGKYVANGYDLTVSLDNYSEVLGMQMDIHWLGGMRALENSLRLSDRLKGFSSTISKISDGVYRVIIFSFNNTPVSGNNGEIFTVTYENAGGAKIENSVVTINNIIFSSLNSQNMSSQQALSYTVPPCLASGISLDKTSISLKASEKETIAVQINPDYTSKKDVTWSTSDETVATVENGVVTAHKVGTATITATTTDGTNLSASCEVTVVATPASSIELDKSAVTLKATESVKLNVTVLPETTTVKDVTWSTSDETVATAENGVVTAHKVGTATITATTTDGTNLSASCEVTVVATPSESVVIDGPRTQSILIGETLQLTAKVCPATATDKSVEWSSSDMSVAKIDSNGLVIAVGIGVVDITAIDKYGNSDKIELEVMPILAENLELNLTQVSAVEGETIKLVAIISPSNVTYKELIWTVCDESVVSLISNGTEAEITILKEGAATITVETVDGSNLVAYCYINAVSSLIEIGTDQIDAEYYTLDGVKVNTTNLKTGVYIKKQGTQIKKVFIS